MKKKKMGKISYREFADAVENYNELQKEADEAYKQLKVLNRNKIADNCPNCEGTGKVEDGYGDPAHNPTAAMLYRKCSKCEGKGYIK